MAKTPGGFDEVFIGHWLGTSHRAVSRWCRRGGGVFSAGWATASAACGADDVQHPDLFNLHCPDVLGHANHGTSRRFAFYFRDGHGRRMVTLGVALVMEIWPAQHRPWLAGVIGAANNVGSCLLAVLGMFFYVTQSSWRWIVLVGALPAFLTFFLRLFVPESERWQTTAREKPIKPMREIFELGLAGRVVLATLLAAVALIGTMGHRAVDPLLGQNQQLTRNGTMPQAKAYAQAISAFGAAVGCVLWRTHRLQARAPARLFSFLHLLARELRAAFPHGGLLWCAVSRADVFRGRAHRHLLRLAAALSAGAFPHARPGDRAGHCVQCGPRARGLRGLADGSAHAAL